MSGKGFLSPIIDENVDTKPIVMIDKSGSTSGKIMEWQLMHLERIMKGKNINMMNVIFWGNRAEIFPDVPVDTIIQHPMGLSNSFGGTDLSTAFEILPKFWYNKHPTVLSMENDQLTSLSDELDDDLLFGESSDDLPNIVPTTVISAENTQQTSFSDEMDDDLFSDESSDDLPTIVPTTILTSPQSVQHNEELAYLSTSVGERTKRVTEYATPRSGERTKDIYIVTDGDLTDDKHNFREQVTKLVRDNPSVKFRIYIICVEGNEDNYEIRNDLKAGGSMYKTICDARLSEHVYSFITYNKHHLFIPFVNIEKHDTKVGFIPWRNMCFSQMDMYMFLEYITELIDENKNNTEVIKRISHDLCTTLYKIVKISNNRFKYDIIDIYIKLFSDTEIYEEIKDLIYNEIINKESGVSLTYIDYRNKRKDVFHQRQIELYKNTIMAIRYGNSVNKFMTFPVYDNKYKIFIHDFKDIKFDVLMRDNVYKMGGVKVGDNVIPVLPMISRCLPEREDINQCIRQYIRAIMSYMYNINAADDMILYLFLTMTMCISKCKDIDPRIVNSLTSLSYVLLNRKRYQTDITELEHLMAGNPPLTVVGDIGNIISIFRRCAKIFEINCKPYTLWYNILEMLGDKKLVEIQKKYCIDDLDMDIYAIDHKSGTNIMFNSELKTKVIDMSSNIGIPEYYDYISFEDTSECGGYTFKPHKYGGDKYVCAPRYVISMESYDKLLLHDIMCPICKRLFGNIDEMLITVEPKDKIDGSVEKLKSLVIDSNYFNNVTNYQILDLEKMKLAENKLVKLDDCKFEYNMAWGFHPNDLIINKILCKKMAQVTNTPDFIESLEKRGCGFLLDMNGDNWTLAGGACRSILLGEAKIKDLDIFIHGLNSDVEYEVKAEWLIREIQKHLDKDMIYTTLYKKNMHVYEMICFKINDTIKDEKSLTTNTTSITELKELEIKNEMRFIDVVRNAKKFKTFHKIQIILLKQKNILDNINRFDLEASQVCFANGEVYLTTHARDIGYKYMINIYDPEKHSDTYYYRLCKYSKYGFSPCFPNANSDVIYDNGKYILKIHGDQYVIHPPKEHEEIKTSGVINACGVRGRALDKKVFKTDIKTIKNLTDGMYSSFAYTLKTTMRYILMMNGQICGMSEKEMLKIHRENPDKITIDKEDIIYYTVTSGGHKINIHEYENGRIDKLDFIDMYPHGVKLDKIMPVGKLKEEEEGEDDQFF